MIGAPRAYIYVCQMCDGPLQEHVTFLMEQQTLKNNNFDGQNCVHLLRTMSKAERDDPKDGVKNQKCIRELWKKITG